MSYKTILATLLLISLLLSGCKGGESGRSDGNESTTDVVIEEVKVEEPSYIRILKSLGKPTDSVTGPLLTETALKLLEKKSYEDAVTLLGEAVQRNVTSVETLYNYGVASSLLLSVNSESEPDLDAIFAALRRAVASDRSYLKKLKNDERLNTLKKDPIYFRFVEIYREFSEKKDEFDMIVNPFFTADFRPSLETSRQISYVNSLEEVNELEDKKSFLYGTWYGGIGNESIIIFEAGGGCISFNFQTYDNQNFTTSNEGSWSFEPVSNKLTIEWPNLMEPVELIIEEVNYSSMKYVGDEFSNVRDVTFLHLASFYDDYNKLQLLFNKGVHPDSNSKGFYPIEYTIDTGEFRTILLFIEYGADITKPDYLFSALYNNRLDVIKAFVDNGVDIFHVDKEKRNYLYLYIKYVENLELEVIKYLLEQGLDPSAKDETEIDVYQLVKNRNENIISDFFKEYRDSKE